MLRRKRYLFLAIFLVGIIIFVSGPKVVAPAVSRMLTNLAASRGVGIALDDLHLGLGLSADSVRLWTRKVPTVELHNFSIKPSFSDLLRGQPSFRSHAEYLKGVIDLAVVRNGSDAMNLSGSLLGLILSEHQVLSTLPVTGGAFDLKVDSLMVSGSELSGIASFAMKPLELTNPVTLPTFLTGLPIPLEIPSFKLNSTSSSISIQKNRLSLTDVALDSDLLSFKGQLSTVLPNFTAIGGQGCLRLTDRGVEKIGAFMPFIGGGSSTEPQTIQFSGSRLNRAKITATAGCDG